MKWSFATVGIMVLGIIGVSIIMLFEQLTTTNENDYYLLKEITEAAMIDAIDLSYYRETGDLKIVEEKFVENFIRRFAESTLIVGTNYNISFYEIISTPPKVTVLIDTGLEQYTIYQDTSDYNVKNTLSAILEYTGENTNVSITSPIYDNPYKSKTYSKTYYSAPTVDEGGQIGVTRALNIPDKLKGEHIKNIKIDSVRYLGVVDTEEELLYSKLNREIDWAGIEINTTKYTDKIGDYATSLINTPESLGYNCGRNDNSYRPDYIDCSKYNYWLHWSGRTNEVRKNAIIAKFQITWSYDEYEYAN